ncbi:MAG: zinc ABC transporter substrate-binding protein [Magnetococcus sp. MYC-9]
MRFPYNRVIVYVCLTILLLPAMAVAGPPVRVVASFSILADMARQIGGEWVTVHSLVGPDGDTHVYEPNAADARELLSADLFLINGLGFEGWIERLIKATGFKGTVVTATDGINRLPLAGEGQTGQNRAADPHAWHDLTNGRIYAANIAAGLLKMVPERADALRARAARYDAQLTELDRWVRSRFATVATDRRKAITNHDAFGYFSRAYGVTFLAPVGASTEAEPSAHAVAQLARQARREGIRTVFVEGLSDPRLMQQLAREAGAAMGGRLYADTLSSPDGPAATYVEMVRHNVTLLSQAMSSAHPPKER